jgi:ammonia channel protein AmtB
MEFLVFGVVAGLVCSIAPAMMANKKNLGDLVNTSVIVCAISGFIGGLLLAVPATLILMAIIYNKEAK